MNYIYSYNIWIQENLILYCEVMTNWESTIHLCCYVLVYLVLIKVLASNFLCFLLDIGFAFTTMVVSRASG